MINDDAYNAFLKQSERAIRITLGSLIHYLDSDVFEEFTEEQRDHVFETVIETWGSLLPPPIEQMWYKHIAFLSLDQTLRAIAQQKAEQEYIKGNDPVMDGIFEQLGWDRL